MRSSINKGCIINIFLFKGKFVENETLFQRKGKPQDVLRMKVVHFFVFK